MQYIPVRSSHNTQQGGDKRMPEQLYSLRDTAGLLGIKESKARELCQRGAKRGGLDAGRIDRRWFVSAQEIERYQEFIKRRG